MCVVIQHIYHRTYILRRYASHTLIRAKCLAFTFSKCAASWGTAPPPLYAVKVQRSLAPLSRFRGSHIPSAHEQQCCRFQSYANSCVIAYEIYRFHCVNHIPGIHDNGPRDHELWRRTLTAYWDAAPWPYWDWAPNSCKMSLFPIFKCWQVWRMVCFWIQQVKKKRVIHKCYFSWRKTAMFRLKDLWWQNLHECVLKKFDMEWRIFCNLWFSKLMWVSNYPCMFHGCCKKFYLLLNKYMYFRFIFTVRCNYFTFEFQKYMYMGEKETTLSKTCSFLPQTICDSVEV